MNPNEVKINISKKLAIGSMNTQKDGFASSKTKVKIEVAAAATDAVVVVEAASRMKGAFTLSRGGWGRGRFWENQRRGQ